MLIEYLEVSQNEKDKGIFRRWFDDNYFDLIVWYNEKKEKIGFQLCYDIYGHERAITMKGNYYVHNKVDQGQTAPGDNRTPILVQDGLFEKDIILDIFIKESTELDNDIREYVIAGIAKYE